MVKFIKLKNKDKKDFLIKQKVFSFLQKIGKSLVFPIAVLPIAALFLRIGILMTSTNLPGISEGNVIWYIGSIFKEIGDAGIKNMASLFAIGIAFGLSEDNRGEAALIGFFAWLVLIGLMKIIPELYYSSIFKSKELTNKSELLYIWKFEKGEKIYIYNIDMGVFGGIIAGILTAFCYNKFKDTKLHPSLSFFSGRRFVPIVVIGATLSLVIVLAAIWPWMQYGLLKFGQVITPKEVNESTRHVQWATAGSYAILNRLLLTVGLHHILNTYFWWQHPFTATDGVVVYGDIAAFLYNNKGALVAGSGVFQSGFFAMMMFGLPCAAFAIINSADKSRRSEVLGLLLGASGVAFLTGVTEPLEFSFMYVAPVLYGVHIIFSGIFASLTVGLGIRIGFGFSAGFIDYALSFYQSIQIAKITWVSGIQQVLANPGMIFPIGLLAGVSYYFTFLYMIKKFDFQTLGREKNIIRNSGKNNSNDQKANQILEILKVDNIINIDNCTTRLRIKIKNSDLIDLDSLKGLGFISVIKIDKQNIQIIVGPDVQFISDQLNEKYKDANSLRDNKDIISF